VAGLDQVVSIHASVRHDHAKKEKKRDYPFLTHIAERLSHYLIASCEFMFESDIRK